MEDVVDSLVVHLEAADAADPGTLLLFVVLAGDEQLDETATRRIREAIRRDLSPRHVPDEVVQVTIPTTLSGKKLELPVKKILLGADVAAVASREALEIQPPWTRSWKSPPNDVPVPAGREHFR